VLRAQADPGEAPASRDRFRVVSDPLREKGRLRIYGCGTAGRHPIVRLDRQASTANAAFDEIVRGDVVDLDRSEQAGDGVRVITETGVSRKRWHGA
jgi:hypothetical protein